MILDTYGQNSESEEVYAIVGGVHGDEPMTAEAIYSIKEILDGEKYDVSKELRLVIGNERALDKQVRYIDTDLNRAFPGDPDSDQYEDRLAYSMYNELKDMNSILSMHSTRSAPPEFAISSNTSSKENLRTIACLPVEYAVNTSNLRGSTMDAQLENTVTVEAGHQGTDNVRKFGIKCSLEFMKSHDIIESEDATYTEKNLIVAQEELPKSQGEPIVYYQNFEEIEKGDVVAEDDKIQHIVEAENKTPVLMSERGYEDIFGLLGEYVRKIDVDTLK